MELQIIQSKIYEIRGIRVMLDFQLAELYQIETKNLKRIEELEASSDAQFSEIYQALTQLLSKPESKPRKPIGYIKNE